jgi:hypothetical protein
MFYEVCCISNNKDYVSQLIQFTLLHFSFVSLVLSSFFYKKKKHFSLHFTSLYFTSVTFAVAVAVNLRPTVSLPVCPGVRRPSLTCDQFLFLLEISFRHLRVLQLQLIYDRHSVSTSLSWCQPPIWGL